MTTMRSVQVQCDRCGRLSVAYEVTITSLRDVLRELAKRGWLRHRRSNGTQWDECPGCIERRTPWDPGGDPGHDHEYATEPSGRGVGYDDVCPCGAIRDRYPTI